MRSSGIDESHFYVVSGVCVIASDLPLYGCFGCFKMFRSMRRVRLRGQASLLLLSSAE